MNKPRVDCEIISFLGVGYKAIVKPYNHPNHMPGHEISNTMPVYTSYVVSYDPDENSFETQHTIYVGTDPGFRISYMEPLEGEYDEGD